MISFEATHEERMAWIDSYFDSPEGKAALGQLSDELKHKSNRVQHCVNYIQLMTQEEFDDLIARLLWKNKSPNHLDRTINLLFQAISRIGKSVRFKFKKDIFLSSAYQYNGYTFKTHTGQGERILEILTSDIIYQSK